MMNLTGESGKSRIVAFIIDNLFASLVAILAVGVVKSENPILSGTILGLTYLLYFFLFEALISRTPGKLFQGLEVRRLDGSRCNLKEHSIRTVARILEANPLLLGGIPAGIAIISSAQKQRLGDYLAGTVVVSKQTLRDTPIV